MIVSTIFPQQPTDPGAIRPFAGMVREHGLARLWMGQSLRIETHLAMAALGSGADAVPVGISTALAALRTPYDAALQARSLAALIGQPVSVSYGAADPGFVGSVRGAPLGRPASYTAEYARCVAGLLRGELVAGEHEELGMQARLPELSHPPVEVGTGVLRPSMATRSRDVAQFVATWLTPRRYVRDVLAPRLQRPDGSAARVVANVHCALARPGRNVHLLTQAACGNHLAAPHYVEMLNRAGLDVSTSDPVSGARELVRHGVFVSGSAQDVVGELEAHGEDGIDEVVVNLTGVMLTYGEEEALMDLKEISEECGRRGLLCHPRS